MNTTTALWFAAVILGVFAADHFWFGWDLWVFLVRQLVRVMHWIAFWH
ncbi:MAG: hypothetical protein ACPGID_06720 [Rubricella sp.]